MKEKKLGKSMGQRGSLRQEIARFFKEMKQPVSLEELYKRFPEHTPSGIRTTVNKMRNRGLLERVHERPSEYVARKLRTDA
jgi:Fe2+ or Zn2+ uptake regulation protein